MKRLLATRGFMSVAGIAVLAIVVVVTYLIAFQPLKRMQSYCALMPDAIGLYAGNNVTMLGVPVGTVTAIHPSGTGVRVDFRIDPAHAPRGAVKATTVSDSLVADRRLAIISDQHSPVKWNPGQCITDTLTPKSITQTLSAVKQLADQLDGSTKPSTHDEVNQGLAKLNAATAGTGTSFNALVRQMSAALASPDAAIGHIGDLIDVASSLSGVVATNWDAIKEMFVRFPTLLDQVNNEIFGPAVVLVNQLRIILPWANKLSQEYGGELLDGLDASVPYLHLLAANVGTLNQIVHLIPGVAAAFQRSIDPRTHTVALTYAPPRAELRQPDAQQICSAVNTLDPGRCSTAAAGLADIDLVPLVLGLAGVR